MSENTAVSKADTRDDAALQPPVDVIEDAAGITLYADLAGVPRTSCICMSKATP
jgi:HSP20 family protein